MSEDQDPYNAGVDIAEVLRNLPPRLGQVLEKIFSMHVGRDNAISRGHLMLDLSSMGLTFSDDRPVRAAINALRKTGRPEYLICSTGGVNGGYWLAASREEVEEFISHELDPRIGDLAETKKAMRRASVEHWGEIIQGRLW